MTTLLPCLAVGCGLDDEGGSRAGLGPANPTELERAIMQQDADEVESLLASGVDPNDQRIPPLQAAAHLESVEIIKLLIDAGAEVDYHDGDNWTALFGAAADGSEEVVQVLLDEGADPCRTTQHSEPQDYSGMRPIDVAIERGNDRVTSILEQATQACQSL